MLGVPTLSTLTRTFKKLFSTACTGAFVLYPNLTLRATATAGELDIRTSLQLAPDGHRTLTMCHSILQVCKEGEKEKEREGRGVQGRKGVTPSVKCQR